MSRHSIHFAAFLLPLVACTTPLVEHGSTAEGGGDGAGGSPDDARVEGGLDQAGIATFSPARTQLSAALATRAPEPSPQLLGEGGAGGTGGAGGSGGAGGEAPAWEACPGETFALELDGAPVVITGTTVGASDDLDTCWSEPGADGGERVYHFTLPASGVLDLELTHGGDLDAALVVRSTCDDDADEYCFDVSDGGERHRLYRTESDLWVVVDAQGATGGEFQLTATLTTGSCGDGVVGPDEACDVGASQFGDGCGDPFTPEACQIQPADGDSDTCPGEVTPVPAGASVLLTSSGLTTLGHADDAIGSCMPEVGGADRVLQLVPAATGTLEVRVGLLADGSDWFCSANPSAPGCFDVELYARSVCDSDAIEDELACSSSCCDGETITIPVVESQPVFLFVDGYDQFGYSMGPFNLHFDLTPDP